MRISPALNIGITCFGLASAVFGLVSVIRAQTVLRQNEDIMASINATIAMNQATEQRLLNLMVVKTALERRLEAALTELKERSQ